MLVCELHLDLYEVVTGSVKPHGLGDAWCASIKPGRGGLCIDGRLQLAPAVILLNIQLGRLIAAFLHGDSD